VGSSHLAAHFDELKVPYEITSLEFADVMFMGNGPEGPVSVGVELKNIFDFINSMHTGRLAGHQIPGLKERYDHVWIIVEGFYRSRKGSGIAEVPRGPTWMPLYLGKRPVFWNELEAFITSIEVQAGIHVRRTRTEHETARLIGTVLLPWWGKQWTDHRSLKQLDIPQAPRLSMREEQDPVKQRMHRVATSFEGIGYERGLKVAQSGEFDSVAEMINGDAEQWQRALGIAKGKKHAQDIYTAIHENVADRKLSKGDGAASRGIRPARAHQSQRKGAVRTQRSSQRSARGS